MDSGHNIPSVNVIVNYDYVASEPDELTMRAGEVVRDVERLAGGWWRGELRGRRGMFPDNFVAVCDPASPRLREGARGRCRVAFSYSPANPDELPLTVGETLDVLGELEEGWWQGRSERGRVGVFPSNFVVMMERQAARPLSEDAPRLPPKPVKERCRVLFPYTAMNEDELTLEEGDVVTLVTREGPDRGWWRGELRGRFGLFPDNFVTIIPSSAADVEEKKPDRPPAKNIYPVLNKYSEKTASVKELSTSKTSLHKEITVGADTKTHKDTSVTHSSRTETERSVAVEGGRNSVEGGRNSVEGGRNSVERSEEAKILDTPDGTGKKPPVPAKKSPTPPSGVGGLFSGLKSKIISSTDKEKWTTVSSSTSSSSGEWDKLDGVASSKAAAPAPAVPASAPTPPAAPAPAAAPGADGFDNVERNSILNDPRAGRVKAPRRRPPSQAPREDVLQQIGLSNGQHDGTADKAEPVKPKAREWEKHKAPWMEELKLNQAKKTSEPSKRASSGPEGPGSKTGAGSTDKLLECGAEDRKTVQSLEMSKSMSSITNRLSVVESFEEVSSKTRHSADASRREPPPAPPTSAPPAPPTSAPPAAAPPAPPLVSPTAAGRTLSSMIEDIKKPMAPSPPVAGVRTSTEGQALADRTTVDKTAVDRTAVERTAVDRTAVDRTAVDRITAASVAEKRISGGEKLVAVERRVKPERVVNATGEVDLMSDQALIAQLSDRILNLERLVEAQSVHFSASLERLSGELAAEARSRAALQAQLDKLAHCVTQV